MENVSRRSFIAGAGAALAATGLMAAAGTHAFADEAAGALVPGTYTGSADGLESAVTVTITVDDSGVISDIVVDTSGETAEIGAAAQDELQAQLLAAGSDDIEGVSGATITSGAAKKAMASALEQAATGAAAPVEDASATPDTASPEVPPPGSARSPSSPTRTASRSSTASCSSWARAPRVTLPP